MLCTDFEWGFLEPMETPLPTPLTPRSMYLSTVLIVEDPIVCVDDTVCDINLK